MNDDINNLEIKISRLKQLSENCRLDIAVPFSIGIVRTLEILYRKNLVSKNEYTRLSKDINTAINKSYKCDCIHPMSIFA